MTSTNSKTTLKASDGHTLSAYLARPTSKPAGTLVLLQEIFGVNNHIRSVADRYAALGYLVIAPSLFDRIQPDIELQYSPDDMQRAREFKDKTSLDLALLDTQAAIAFGAQDSAVGVIGYCWGGLVAWLSAARLSDLACAVCYYPGGVLQYPTEKPRCPVQMHFGEADTMIPIDGVKAFSQAHADPAIFTYPAGHGFNCDQRTSYNAESASLALQRTTAFLTDHLLRVPAKH